MAVRGGLGALVFIGFLKRLIQGRRPVFLIADGHPVHRARIVRTYVEVRAEKLRLFYLQPYSPDELNSSELVWNDVKNNGVARTLIAKQADLKKAVVARLCYLQKTPGHVCSFFQASQIKYAS